MEEASLPYSAETISFSVANCDIIDKDEYVYVKVDDLEPYTKAGEPALPMETFTVKLPKNARVVDVKVVSGSCKEIEGMLKIAPTAEPLAWMIKSGMKQKTEITRVPDEQVYALDSYLPGNAVSYDVGCDGDYKYVFVRLYPVQYNPQREKAVLITEAQVKVYYTEDAVVKTVSDETPITARNIILAPPELHSQAEDLKEFHEGDGTSTEVIDTTWIYQNYDESPDPPYSGYNDSTKRGWDNIQGYNYSLAKRTIAFLHDSDAHPDLEYVTLLGNARLLPPSYYAYIRHYYSYDNWIPTDYFYGSPDFDLVPNYRVGRIPVNNSTEADHVVRKIAAWDATLDWDWFKNVSLAGGQPFGTEYYMGELIIANAINNESFNGMNIEKLYRTDERFTVEELLAAHSGGTGILYSITHGNGECIATENGDDSHGAGRICAEDLLALPENSKTPIVVSIACMNGAFDTNVVDSGVPLSFGEAVLLSNAAGIAYIGGSRVNYGSPDFYIENGYLHTTKEQHMAGMLTNVFAAYHGGAVTLGDVTKTAITTYVAENNFTDDINLVTLFEFTLLGDPALAIPEQQPGVSYQQPVVSAASPDGELNNIPWYEVDAPIITSIATDSPVVTTKRIVAPRDITVETVEDSTVGGTTDYSFSSPVRTEYLVRPSTDDGKEGWFYVRSLARTYIDVAGNATELWNKSVGELGDELYISVNPVEDLDGDGLDDAMIRGESFPWFWFYGAMDSNGSVADHIFGSTPETHGRAADIFDENGIDPELHRPNSDVERIYDRFNTSRGHEIVASVFDEDRTHPRSRRPDLSEKRLHDRFNASPGHEIREMYDSRFQSMVSSSMHSEVDVCRGYDGEEFWNESVNGTYCWIDTEAVGDLDCDGGTDFLVKTTVFDWEAETYSCSVAVRSGFDGTTLWEESVSGEGDGYASAYPVDDLNGDGIMDFIVRIETCDYETNTSSCSVAAKMGHNGTDIWSRSTSGAG
ncbi:MAG: C25 family cysteine peptidase, partial [Euryarchaeota archaeon]|nr:C25 family cysteine peptidase [Euryarchaeota archaeon]